MISRAKKWPQTSILVLLLLVLSLFLVACERPLDDGEAEADPTAEVTSDPNQGGGTDAMPTEPAPTVEAPTVEAPRVEEEEEEAEADESSAIPSDDPESAITPEESIEAEGEEAAEAVEESAEEAAEAVEETAEEVAEEATDEAAEETDESAAAGDQDDSEADEDGDSTEADATTSESDESEAAEADATAEAGEAESESVAAEGDVTHVVQPGENLFRIGLQYGVSWQVLADYNNLPNANSIYVGQSLLIPGEAGDGETPSGDPVTYVVQPGDTLFEIGQMFDVDWREIAEANEITNPYRIYVGTVLTIPADTPPPASDVSHTVSQGETLYTISREYDVPWLIIADANGIIAPYLIYPGQVLTIPGGGS